MFTRSFCAAFVAALCGSLSAQSPFATSVVNYQQGTGGGIFVQQNILGGPLGGGLGGGSLDVLTLGEGGSVVLGFDFVLHDGPGADLAVFENGFMFGGDQVFAEVGFVEVSSNGTDFARFPSRFAPPAAGGTPMGTFAGLGGGMPVIANVAQDPDSPFDPAHAGGEALDFADLAADPLVVGGQLDLQDVHFVRLVDVTPGSTDSQGTVISSAALGGVDFDAVAALHHDGQAAGGPVCDLSLDAQGFLVLRLGDPDGLSDLNLATLASSVSLAELPFSVLFNVLIVTSFDGKVAELRSVAPVTGAGFTLALGTSVQDDGGAIGGDQLMVQD
jgi:hypothetical protein